MIVGVDSGTWRAFAIIDFSGNLIALKSGKNWSEDDFIREISDFYPTVIACDKNPTPKKVLTLKTVFGARLYKPKKSISLIQKHSLTRDFKVRNSHERDALAAALKAFRSLSGKLSSVEKKAERAGVRKQARDALKRMVLKGTSVSNALKSWLE